MITIKFNKSVASKMTKDQFVKNFKDTFKDVDLELEYYKMFPDRKKAENTEK